jgi:hypothetical protein
MSKADDERQVFESFAIAARLEAESIESRKPPYPDISCRIGNVVRYFELTRAANQGIADEVGRLLAKARKTGESGVGRAQVYNDEATLRAAVARKAESSHETDGAPLDLVVYYDGVFHPAPEFEWIEQAVSELRAQYCGRWNAIWLYDHTTKRLLG